MIPHAPLAALLTLLFGWPAALVQAATVTPNPGNEVVILYNRRSADSKNLADHYAARRAVPTNQILGLDLPTGETISRAEFNSQLRDPLVEFITARSLMTWAPTPSPDDPASPAPTHLTAPTSATVRYLVLCREIPLKILKDDSLQEPNLDKLRPELRRNEAAVDSELAILPAVRASLPLHGPLSNPAYGATNSARLHPTNGILLVARLDGPTPEIARSLIDKALRAETNGLWGRAYFDARGLTNGSYKLGDDWILTGAKIAMAFGLETATDSRPETYSAGFPMSHIALYAGWYDGQASGPFTRPDVEFVPGAIAYHLHSFSAATIRSPTQNWVGPLLAKGATATLGCVEEPYLEGTPNIAVLIERITMQGMTFAEAATAAQPALSWQTTVVGDPLYRPFGRPPKLQHDQLLQTHDPLVEWSHLRIVNINLASGTPPHQLLDYLSNEKISLTSSVLQEKIGDLALATAKFPESIEAYRKALTLPTSSNQKLRIQLALARALSLYQEKDQALATLRQILEERPDYPDRPLILERMLTLAKALRNEDETKRLQTELERYQTQDNKQK